MACLLLRQCWLALQDLFPFKSYFADAPGTLFAGMEYEADLEKARGCWRHLRTMFQELEECRAFELLKVFLIPSLSTYCAVTAWPLFVSLLPAGHPDHGPHLMLLLHILFMPNSMVYSRTVLQYLVVHMLCCCCWSPLVVTVLLLLATSASIALSQHAVSAQADTGLYSPSLGH